jgi:hypothetical protein
MVDHARTAGGPAVRALTFHERAGLLKKLAKHLSADPGGREELSTLSSRTGATGRDSVIDIDGGFGTLFSYASKGTRELPNDVIVMDGPPEPLGRGGTFAGRHVYTSRPEVAVRHRGRRPAHHRIRHPPRERPATALRRRRHSARPPRRPGLGGLHRLRAHRRPSASAPVGGARRI